MLVSVVLVKFKSVSQIHSRVLQKSSEQAVPFCYCFLQRNHVQFAPNILHCLQKTVLVSKCFSLTTRGHNGLQTRDQNFPEAHTRFQKDIHASMTQVQFPDTYGTGSKQTFAIYAPIELSFDFREPIYRICASNPALRLLNYA